MREGAAYPTSAVQATGLALPQSDLDIVVLGVGPHAEAGSYLSSEQVEWIFLRMMPLRSSQADRVGYDDCIEIHALWLVLKRC